ncbi:MAG: hypothetical protein F6K50_41150 [Moorea sp. SIO3I7]|nr:hypothetical protein [Moorena sp. SIO3I7]
MKAWAVEELQYAELGDVRRKKRLMRIGARFGSPTECQCAASFGKLSSDPGSL